MKIDVEDEDATDTLSKILSSTPRPSPSYHTLSHPHPPIPYGVTGEHVGGQFQMLLNLDVGPPLGGWHRA